MRNRIAMLTDPASPDLLGGALRDGGRLRIESGGAPGIVFELPASASAEELARRFAAPPLDAVRLAWSGELSQRERILLGDAGVLGLRGRGGVGRALDISPRWIEAARKSFRSLVPALVTLLDEAWDLPSGWPFLRGALVAGARLDRDQLCEIGDCGRCEGVARLQPGERSRTRLLCEVEIREGLAIETLPKAIAWRTGTAVESG